MRTKMLLWPVSLLLLLTAACQPTRIIDSEPENEPIRIVGTVASPTPESMEAQVTEAVSASPVATETPAPTVPPTETPEPTFTPSPAPTVEPTNTPKPDTSKAEQFADAALKLMDAPYVRGGTSLEEDGGFDPGGFVYHCLNAVGNEVRHRSSKGYAEVEEWAKIENMEELMVGDLCFFMTGDNESVNCVCIYVGDGEMVYPSSGEGKVIKSRITNDYWTEAFVFARRVF